MMTVAIADNRFLTALWLALWSTPFFTAGLAGCIFWVQRAVDSTGDILWFFGWWAYVIILFNGMCHPNRVLFYVLILLLFAECGWVLAGVSGNCSCAFHVP